MPLNDRVVLVTGAASGIGRATAELFAAEGALVAVTDSDEAGARKVAAGIASTGGTATAFKLDVTAERDWEAAVATLRETAGRVDILVACAGIAHARPVTEMSLEEWRRVHAVNLDGVFLGAKHVIPAIRDAGGGSIVIVASVSGIEPSPGASAYCSSKAALRLFAKTVALECAERGDRIRVNTVSPGAVRTPMWKGTPIWERLRAEHGSEDDAWKALGAGSPLERVAEPEEIARAILFLASDDASYVTGADLIMGGY